MIEIKVPSFGESIQEVQIANWLKQEGDWIAQDEELVELESEKATQAFPSPASGTLQSIRVKVGQFAKVGDVIAVLIPGLIPGDKPSAKVAATSHKSTTPGPSTEEDDINPTFVMPAAQRLLNEKQLSAADVQASGLGGRMQKGDVLRHVEQLSKQPDPGRKSSESTALNRPPAESRNQGNTNESHEYAEAGFSREEEIRPMSMIRRTIASRLVEAQQNAALLSTFNEIDMQPVMELRSKYKDAFSEKHGVKLGFMSFFAKATVEALKRFPSINSEVRGQDVVYRNYFDIGVAIGGGKGLVVPVLRDVQRMSFAEIERRIGKLAELAKDNKIKPADIDGGTFTISNGGVYGSLLSTPIVNPPQSGILGLHAIQERPVARDGQVVIRPMMYIALTYDHRIVDGREAVGFLRTIKEVLEEPARLFLEV
jgi:2-oxoglutarate dehydrogenase E2 component (dihydrolipoamide succinyltransferase)